MIFPPLNCLCQKSFDSMCMILFLDSLFFPHLSVYLFMPIPYFLNYYSFTVSVEIMQYKSFKFVLFQGCLDCPRSFIFLYKIYYQLTSTFHFLITQLLEVLFLFELMFPGSPVTSQFCSVKKCEYGYFLFHRESNMVLGRKLPLWSQTSRGLNLDSGCMSSASN